MKLNTIHPTILTASLLLFPFTTAQTDRPSGNCTVFNWGGAGAPESERYFYSYYSLTPERISGAQSCPQRPNSTHSCALAADGDLQVSFRINATSVIRDSSWNGPAGPTSFFYNTIYSVISPFFNEGNPEFNYSAIGIIDRTVPLTPGQAGYLNLYPLLRCVQGTFSNCTGGIEDGVGVEACAPVVSVDSTAKILNGRVEVRNVSLEDVGNYRDPFAGQSRGGAGGFGVSVLGLMGAVVVAVVPVGLF